MTGAPTGPDIALDAIQRYPDAGNPSSFLAVNEGNSYLHLPDTPGVIVYRPTGRYLVQFGGPFAPKETRPAGRHPSGVHRFPARSQHPGSGARLPGLQRSLGMRWRRPQPARESAGVPAMRSRRECHAG